MSAVSIASPSRPAHRSGKASQLTIAGTLLESVKSTGSSTEFCSKLWDKDRRPSPFRLCAIQLASQLEPKLTTVKFYESAPEVEEFDVLAVVNTMANLGYSVRKLRVSPNNIDARLLPCLFIPSATSETCPDGPFVILSVQNTPSGERLKVYDGANDSVEDHDSDSAFTNLDGTVYLFRKMNSEELSTSKEIRTQSGKSWFHAIINRFNPVIWQLVAISFVLNIVSLTPPLFIMLVYDRVISPQTTQYMPMLITGVALALCFEFVLRKLRVSLVSWITARSHFIVGTEVFRKILDLPPSLSSQSSVTAQISRIRSFESVREFFSGPIFSSVLELPSILIAVVVLLFFDPLLAAIPFFVSLTFVALFFVLQRFVSSQIKHAATESAIAQKFSIETFQQQEQIRMSGLADIWKTKFREISGRDNAALARLYMLGAVGENLGYFISVAAGLLTLIVGVELVWSGDITTGMLVASMILIWRALAPFYSICSLIPRFEQFRNSVKQINSLMEVKSESELRKASARIPGIIGEVKFENVTLRHPRETTPVFVGLNVTIRPGEAVAILGASGSGKTSVINLVQAICHPQLGRVCMDGFNIQQLVAQDYRRQLGFIPQTPGHLFGSISETLKSVKPDASEKELWRALAMAGVDSEVKSLPNKLNHGFDVTSHAANRELFYRLAFARVFLQNPSVILIDEIPNTVLNNGIDQLLADMIGSFRGNKTIMFVSQRVDQMRIADKVIALRRGRTPVVGPIEKILETAV